MIHMQSWRFMRRALAAGTIALAAAGTLRAQSTPLPATSLLTIGPAASVGASMSINPPDGLKVAPSFAYGFGAEMIYPLTSTIGGTFGLGYQNRAIRLRSLVSADVYQSTRVGYFSITPGVHFSSFWIGMNFGLPLAGSLTTQSGPGVPSSTETMDDDAFERVEVMIEPRIGALIPVYEGNAGWMAISFSGGFSLNEFFDRGEMPANPDKELGNYQTVSAHFGLTYQFAIPGTER